MSKAYLYTMKEATQLANDVKDAVLKGLEAEGLLTKPAKDISEDYAVVISESTWLGRFFAKKWCTNPEMWYIHWFKNVPFSE